MITPESCQGISPGYLEVISCRSLSSPVAWIVLLVKKELDLSPVGAKIPCERLQLVMAEIDLAEVGGKEMLAGSASFEGCPGWGVETISPLYVEGWLLEIVSHFLLCREQY